MTSEKDELRKTFYFSVTCGYFRGTAWGCIRLGTRWESERVEKEKSFVLKCFKFGSKSKPTSNSSVR